MNQQVLYLIAPIVSIITASYIAVMGIYYRDQLKTENVLMSVICLLWAGLSISYVAKLFITDEYSLLMVERVTHLALVFLPVIHIHFFHKVLRIKERKITLLAWFFTLLFSGLVFTRFYIEGLKLYPWGYIGQAGPAFWFFIVFACATVFYIVNHASNILKKEKNRIVKIKFRYARFSFICTALITLVSAPAVEGVALYPPAYFVFLPLGFLGYGILRYRILGVWTILHVSLRWLLVLLLCMIPNFIIYLFIYPYLIRATQTSLFALLTIWFVFSYMLLRKINSHISEVIHIEGFDMKKVEVSFFKNIFYLKNIQELIDEFSHMMTTYLGFSGVDAFILSEHDGVYENTHGEKITLSEDLDTWFIAFDKVVERHMVDAIPYFMEQRDELLALLSSRDASLIVPLCQHEKLLSLVFLKDDYLSRLMTKSEVQTIDQLSAFVSISLYNSLMYRDINDLKDRLEEKTRKLSKEIAERENAEKEIIKSKEQYKLLADNVKDVIFVMDIDSMAVTYVSPSVETLLGYSVDEVRQMTLEDIFERESYEYIKKLRTHVVANKRVYSNEDLVIELEEIRKDGKRVWVEISTHFLDQETADPKFLIGVSRDITERKKAEKEKKNMEAKLLQAQKMESIGVLAGGIAHDFNNILMAILGYTQLTRIYVPEENKEAHEKLSRIEKASFRAKDMVSQILAFSRQNDPVKLPVQVVPVISEAMKLLKGTLPANIILIEDFEDNVPSIMADPVQIHQVVINLCSNASHAMEDTGGECRISVSKHRMDYKEAQALNLPKGVYVRLVVEDTGIGMDQEVMDKIFDPYFTTKEIGRGTGMGLAVVHGIVLGGGGKIRVDSKPGKGSRFEILFPAAVIPVSQAEENDAMDPGRGQERVLFVDDEADIREFAEECLGAMGYQVSTAGDGKTALGMVQSDPGGFDVVITDLSMPDISGEVLAAEINRIRTDLPVILCTGYNTFLPGKNTPDTAIADILIKPVPSKDLADAIRSALDSK